MHLQVFAVDTYQALGFCRVIQEWNCILLSCTRIVVCMEDSDAYFWILRVSSSKQGSASMLCVLSYLRKVAFKRLTFFNLCCLTFHSPSFFAVLSNSSSQVRRTVSLERMQSLCTCKPAKRYGTCPADTAKGGGKLLGRLHPKQWSVAAEL